MSSTTAQHPGEPPPGEDRWAAREKAARDLAGVYPQHRMIKRLKGYLGSDTEDAAVLTEMLACCHRLRANLDGIEAEILQRLQEARPSSDLAEELAARLSMTTRAADWMLERAAALEEYMEVHFALLAGDIDLRKAEVFIDATTTVPPAQTRAIHRTLLPDAPTLTTGQLRHRLRAAVLAVDADLAQERHEEAVTKRHVSVDAADDGMAFLTFYLPATDAIAAMTTLDALAVKNDSADDRSVGARRVDAFADLINTVLTTGRTPDGSPLPTQHRTRPHIVLTVAQSTLDGKDDAPGYLAGYGPLSADIIRHLATEQAATTDDPAASTGSGAGAESEGTESDGAESDGRRCDQPLTGAAVPAIRAKTVRTDAFTGTLLPITPRGAPGAIPDGWLPGQEPLSVINTLLQPGCDIDPVSVLAASGILATDAYQPGRALRDYVLSRDVTCRFPTCRQPARRCQLDHIVAFDPTKAAWAQTHQGNLQLLCARHHQLKTEGIWAVHRDHHTGDTHWTSPLGYHYTRPAEIIDPAHHIAALARALRAIGTERSDDPDFLDRPAILAPGVISDAELAGLTCGDPAHTDHRSTRGHQCPCGRQAEDISAIVRRLRPRDQKPQPPHSASVLEVISRTVRKAARSHRYPNTTDPPPF